MNRQRAHSLLDRDDDSRITLIVPAGSPCRSIFGCTARATHGGRCDAHQDSRVSPAVTVGKLPRLVETPAELRTRLCAELVAIASRHVAANMRSALEASR